MTVKITAKLLDAINRKRPEAYSQSAWIVSELERLNAIQLRVRVLNEKMEDARKKLKDELAKLEHEKQAVFRLCDHLDTTYHPDASGGNDSTTVCNICGRYDV